MINDAIFQKYSEWLSKATDDPDLISELKQMGTNSVEMEEAFFQDLAFGTGGLRGFLGAGTNRMNIYTVARATQGFSDYINRTYPPEKRSAAISYDSRNKSDLFAKVTASVFAANGIHAYLYRELMPTPCLSFAVRELGCAAGVMITASHNPAAYNGYKAYNHEGCQIATEAAEEILASINRLNYFEDPKMGSFEELLDSGMISYIPDSVYTAFVNRVRQESVLGPDDVVDRNVSIVYSPLNGTGLRPVLRTLEESGFTDITVVEEQRYPDGDFPTCPYPNPEIREAMKLGIEYAERERADLLLATDPDCDRVGIAVRDANGEYRLMSGNEVGILLLDFILSMRKKNGTLPKDPVFIKTIVTSDLTEKIAAAYGARTINVLTGFKYIGEQIAALEKEGKEDSYVLGFEESYGYLSGPYVRDKDAVNGALMICEMFAYYRTQGISLLEKLDEIYRRFGYCRNALRSFEFGGIAGMRKMRALMKAFRKGLKEIGGVASEKLLDYETGIDGLPKSDVVKFYLKDGSTVTIRPSGTEPKIKVYLSVQAKDQKSASEEADRLMGDMQDQISSFRE